MLRSSSRTIAVFLLMLATGFGMQVVNAQTSFKGKDIAIYFSKKYFTFPEDYRFLVPGFIKSDQGRNVPLEDLRQQTLISLGNLLAEQLDSATQAKNTWFLNEHPDKTSLFLESYTSDSNALEPLHDALTGTDAVLVVNPLSLTGYRRKIVYVRSDRVISEYEFVKTAQVSLTLFEPSTGEKLASTVVCFDSFLDKVDQSKFDFRSKTSPLGKFLSDVFTLGILQLQEGISSTCE